MSDVGEFGLIARITAALAGAGEAATTLLGPGDDAAVVAAEDGRVVAGTDILIEGTHFRRDWSSAEDIGHKAAAKNFADIAAMGAVPTALLVGFGVPGDLPLSWVDGLVAGLREEVGGVGAAVVGGDVVRSDNIVIAATALGDLQGRAPVTVAGARAGDIVAVTGRLGWAAAGFVVLGRGFRSPVPVVAAQRRPDVPYAAGPQAAELGATAMTDVSDGLVTISAPSPEPAGCASTFAALAAGTGEAGRGGRGAQRRPVRPGCSPAATTTHWWRRSRARSRCPTVARHRRRLRR